MSLMWRRNIVDGGTGYKLMIKNGHLVPKGNICPCNDKWYIVSVCPCPNCQRHRKYFLGSTVMSGEDPVTIEYAGDPTTLYALNIAWHSPVDSATNNPPGKADQWAADNIPLGAILLAVSHVTNETPYENCSVHAELFIDGVSKAEWSGGGYSSGVAVEIGSGITGQSTAKVLEVAEGAGHVFESAGCNHNVDLVVTFSAIGRESVVYSCRQTYRVVDGGSEFVMPWVGDIAVIPYSPRMFDFACVIEGQHPTYGIQMAMYINPLRGPFDSQADAAATLAHFAAFIHAYAATCTCDNDCGSVGMAADGLAYHDGSWWLDRAAAGDNANAGCDTGWMEYDYSIIKDEFPEGASVQAVLTDPFGGEHEADETGLIPPCWRLAFRAIGFGGHETFEDSPLSGGATGTLTVKCVTDDDESEFYGLRWDYIPWDENVPATPPEGVPNSSSELRNYEAYLGNLE